MILMDTAEENPSVLNHQVRVTLFHICPNVSLLICKRKLLGISPLLETPSICNDENLLSRIISDITFQTYIINQRVGE